MPFDIPFALLYLFDNISHKFRTPLPMLLGPLENLLAGTHGELSRTQRVALELAHRPASEGWTVRGAVAKSYQLIRLRS